jgi:hypothetical protein
MATIKYQTESGATFDVSDVEMLTEQELQDAIEAELEDLDELDSSAILIDYDGIPERFILNNCELDAEYFELQESEAPEGFEAHFVQFDSVIGIRTEALSDGSTVYNTQYWSGEDLWLDIPARDLPDAERRVDLLVRAIFK